MAKEISKLNNYTFLTGKKFQAWAEEYLEGKDVDILRYFTYCDALFFDELIQVVGENPGIGLGDAKYIVTRITSAMVREGLQFQILNENGKEIEEVQTFVQSVWDKNLMSAKEVDAEQYASRKGRGVFILNYSADSKRIIIRTIDPEYIWPIYNEYRELIGYKYIRLTDKTQNGLKVVYRELYRKTKDKVTKTTGEYVTKKDKAGLVTWTATTDTPEKTETLDIDFLPIIHFNNKPGDELEPESDLQSVITALEKLYRNNADTDETASMEASPPVVIEGKEPVLRKTKETSSKSIDDIKLLQKYSLGRGKVIFTGESGNKAYILDVSHLLDALQTYDNMLTDKLYVNSHLTRVGAGALAGKDWPAWESLAMALGPLIDMVTMKHTIRREKYALLVKFVIRYGVAKKLVTFTGKIDEVDVSIKFPQVLPASALREKEFALDAYDKGMYDLETALTEIKRSGADIDIPTVISRVKSQEKLYNESMQSILDKKPDAVQNEKQEVSDNL